LADLLTAVENWRKSRNQQDSADFLKEKEVD
jgi:hypothetical protein